MKARNENSLSPGAGLVLVLVRVASITTFTNQDEKRSVSGFQAASDIGTSARCDSGGLPCVAAAATIVRTRSPSTHGAVRPNPRQVLISRWFKVRNLQINGKKSSRAVSDNGTRRVTGSSGVKAPAAARACLLHCSSSSELTEEEQEDLTDWLSDCLTDCLTVCLTDWLTV